MESLERLAGSIAQVELLVASLKRENRDLSGRLAQAAADRHAAVEEASARAEALARELEAAQGALRVDPGLEARAHQAELESAELAQKLDAAQRQHLEEKGRFEALIRQLEAQMMAARGSEELPVASAEELAEAEQRRLQTLQDLEAARGRTATLEAQLGEQRSALDAMADAEARASQEAEALKARLSEQEKRITALEGNGLDLERQLSEARVRLAEAPKPEDVALWKARLKELEALALNAAEVDAAWDKLQTEKAELRRRQKDLAAFAKERQTLRRKVDELVSTLESVRLG
jgi:chromosome segregation protein